MLNGPNHQRPAANQHERALHDRRSRRLLARIVHAIGGRRAAGNLRSVFLVQIDIALNLQIVEPDVGRSLPGIGIDHNQIDIGLARVDLAALRA